MPKKFLKVRPDYKAISKATGLSEGVIRRDFNNLKLIKPVKAKIYADAFKCSINDIYESIL